MFLKILVKIQKIFISVIVKSQHYDYLNKLIADKMKDETVCVAI